MILLMANFLLALVGGTFLLLGQTAPLLVAIPCVIFGGVVVASRFLAWTSGAAQGGYAFAARSGSAVITIMMVIMELLYWGLALLNVWVFVSRFLG